MPTKSFWNSYYRARDRNRMLSYEKKCHIWKHIKRDWGNGTNKKQPYIPFPEAEKIHKSLARVVVLACGNRFAKSLISAMEACAILTIPGTKTWVVGAAYEVCNNEWDYIEHAITKTDLWNVYICNQLRRKLKAIGEDPDEYTNEDLKKFRKVYDTKPKKIIIKWPGEANSIIEQKSYGADWISMEGAKVNLIIYAEGSRIPAKLRDRHLKKRLSDLYGKEMIPATPKGKDGVLYPSYQKGLSLRLEVDIDWNNKKVSPIYKKVRTGKYHVDNAESYAESYETFQYPGYVNPYYNMDDYNSDVALLFDGKLDPSLFKERNFGTFESLSGNYFMGIEQDKVFVDSFPLPEKVTCYRAIDPGRAGQACCLWVAVQPWEGNKYRYIVYNELYKSDLWLEKFVEMVKQGTHRRIVYSAADRNVGNKTFDNKRTVEQRMKELGINPLKTPHGMPYTTIERLNLWLPDIKDGRIIIFKDKCPNFMDEILDAEYMEPKNIDGVEVRVEKLKNKRVHAIDSFNYLRWTNPKYIDPELIQRAEKKVQIIQPMSLAAALKKRDRQDSEGLLAMLKG